MITYDIRTSRQKCKFRGRWCLFSQMIVPLTLRKNNGLLRLHQKSQLIQTTHEAQPMHINRTTSWTTIYNYHKQKLSRTNTNNLFAKEGMGSGNASAVKVVIITTQLVETDARSFKSVVQSLTGKDSTIPPAAQPPQPAGGVSASYNSAPVLTRGMSFRDFERMMNELN